MYLPRASRSAWSHAAVALLLAAWAGAAQAGGLTILHQFDAYSQPKGGLILGTDGRLYGSTMSGGSYSCGWWNCGTIFAINTDGTGFVVLKEFHGGLDGQEPQTPLLQASDGFLYGVARGAGGGGRDDGFVFRMSTDGTVFQNLHNFNFFVDGTMPESGPIQGPDGLLYGTTAGGGSPWGGTGTIYRISTDGSFFQLLKTLQGPEGDDPNRWARLLLASNGFLYGLTTRTWDHSLDIITSLGTLFQLAPDGSYFNNNHLFAPPSYCSINYNPCYFDPSLGYYPDGGLMQASDGFIYGTVSSGAAYGAGGIFRIALDGSGYALMHSFNGTDGQYAKGNIIQGSDGFLYGLTEGGGGGWSGSGVLYRIRPGGSNFSVVHAFDDTLALNEGVRPLGGLVHTPDGFLYGTTQYGGANGGGTIWPGAGTLYKVDTLTCHTTCTMPASGSMTCAAGTGLGTASVIIPEGSLPPGATLDIDCNGRAKNLSLNPYMDVTSALEFQFKSSVPVGALDCDGAVDSNGVPITVGGTNGVGTCRQEVANPIGWTEARNVVSGTTAFANADGICTDSAAAPTMIFYDSDHDCNITTGTIFAIVGTPVTTAPRALTNWGYVDSNRNGKYDPGEALSTRTQRNLDGICTNSATAPTYIYFDSDHDCNITTGTITPILGTPATTQPKPLPGWTYYDANGNGAYDPTGCPAACSEPIYTGVLVVPYGNGAEALKLCTDDLGKPTYIFAKAADCDPTTNLASIAVLRGSLPGSTTGVIFVPAQSGWAFFDRNNDGIYTLGEELYLLPKIKMSWTSWCPASATQANDYVVLSGCEAEAAANAAAVCAGTPPAGIPSVACAVKENALTISRNGYFLQKPRLGMTSNFASLGAQCALNSLAYLYTNNAPLVPGVVNAEYGQGCVQGLLSTGLTVPVPNSGAAYASANGLADPALNNTFAYASPFSVHRLFAPTDRDGDGVPDNFSDFDGALGPEEEDQCPLIPGKVAGCPAGIMASFTRVKPPQNERGIEGALVNAYSVAAGTCAGRIGRKPSDFAAVWASCGDFVSQQRTTDASGHALLGVPPGEYLVLTQDPVTGAIDGALAMGLKVGQTRPVFLHIVPSH